MFNLEPESSSPVLGSPDPIKAGINGTEDEMRSLSNLEFGAESAIEQLMPAAVEESELLASDGLGATSVDKPPEVGKDLLTGEAEDATVGEVDALTGGGSDRSKIETRARKGDFAGNSRGKAYNIGELRETEVFGDAVSKSDRRDLYKFRVKEKTDVAIALDELDGSADLFLLNNKGTVLEKSVKGGKRAEEISMELEPGVYYGEVRSKGSATANYEITFDGEGTELPEEGLQVRNSRKRKWQRFQVGTLSDSYYDWGSVNTNEPDAYIFTLNKASELEIELSDLSDNADLYLYNKKGKLLIRSRNSGSTDETINVDLKPGKYAVGVRTKERWSNIDYELEINAAPRTRNTGILRGSKPFEGDVSRFDRLDYYKFTLDESKQVDISLSGLSDNADLYLGKAENRKFKTIVPSKNSGTSDEAISHALDKGDYYVAVKSATKRDNTEYELVMSEKPSLYEEDTTGSDWRGSFYRLDGGQPSADFYQNEANKLAVLNLGSSSDKSFSHDWGTGSPKSEYIPSDNFALRSYTHASFEQGKEYEFNVNADDGYQLLAKQHGTNDWVYITPQNEWKTDAYDGKTITYSWEGLSGNYDLHFHYYEGGGNARFNLNWKVLDNQNSDDWEQYTIQPGDTLLDIANRYNSTVEEIAARNNIPNPNLINAGVPIWIPKTSSTNGGSDDSGNTGNGYYSELSSLTDDEWDEYSGDNTRFDPQRWDDGVDETAKTPESIAQIYTDLSTTIFGERKLMNSGYLNDISYHKGFGAWHAGLDMKGVDLPLVKTPVGGTVAWTWENSDAGVFIGVNSDDGNQWVYGHLQTKGNWINGNRINAGDVIGQVGSQPKAYHLHLEVRTPPFQKTNGAHSDKNFLRSATMSPLQAYWELKNG